MIKSSYIYLNILIFLLSTSGLLASEKNKSSLINCPWGKLFNIKPTESGDSVSVGAVFSNDTDFFIYSLADGKVVEFDSTGTIIKTVKLQSVGRGTYTGDDFVVKGTEFIFLNSIDKRLEFFDISNGTHTRSVQVSQNILANEPTRSRKLINRIFLQNGTILIGNEHIAVPLDITLGKQLSTSKVLRVNDNERLLCAGSGKVITSEGNKIKGLSCIKCNKPDTHYPVYGKRFILIGERLFSLVLTTEGVQLIRVQ